MKPLVKTICFVFLLSCFGFAGSHAGWIENGVPLTRQWWGTVGGGVIVSDGSSGAIVAYQACRDGVGHVIVQRVDSMGVTLWAQEGVDVCADTSYQAHPQITSDGARGAIITWEDHRSGNWDVYAQRVDSTGSVQWTGGDVVLSPLTSCESPRITSDGWGGAIVTWVDYRGGNGDIYAQRVDALGDSVWAANGVPICTATGTQYNQQIIPDGAGGAIITWEDYRGNDCDIYALLVNESGTRNPLWTVNGVSICKATANQVAERIVSDGLGGAIITWTDYRIGGDIDIYAQRVSLDGTIFGSWPADGVPLCTAAGTQDGSAVAPDGAHGAIIVWRDIRDYYHSDIYAARVTAWGCVPAGMDPPR